MMSRDAKPRALNMKKTRTPRALRTRAANPAELTPRWMFYPRSTRPTRIALEVINCFANAQDEIASKLHDEMSSDAVLAALAPHLRLAGFRVEASKKHVDKITVPVLLGERGTFDKSFDADAFHPGDRDGEGFVLEVESGRGWTNNQFLKDLFQACVMQDVTHLAIAVRQWYPSSGTRDYELVCRFFETLFASDRLRLPLKGILIVGY
jgi:hypothetical protein